MCSTAMIPTSRPRSSAAKRPVKGREGLVHQEQIGRGDHGARDGHPLAHSCPACSPAASPSPARPSHSSAARPACSRPACSRSAASRATFLCAVHQGSRRGSWLLEDVAEPAGALDRCGGDRLGRRTRDGSQQGRLADARGSGDDEDPVGSQLEGQPAQQRRAPARQGQPARTQGGAPSQRARDPCPGMRSQKPG